MSAGPKRTFTLTLQTSNDATTPLHIEGSLAGKSGIYKG